MGELEAEALGCTCAPSELWLLRAGNPLASELAELSLQSCTGDAAVSCLPLTEPGDMEARPGIAAATDKSGGATAAGDPAEKPGIAGAAALGVEAPDASRAPW